MTDEKPQVAEPKGVIAIMTSPDGEVIATATDFNRSGMGGCKLWEAQMWRARDQVKWATAAPFSLPVERGIEMALLTIEELEQRPAVTFPKGNNIAYWQDFSGWRGIPSGLTFYIIGDAPPQHKSFYLAARGYGAKEDYGNGTIMVKKSDCDRPSNAKTGE